MENENKKTVLGIIDMGINQWLRGEIDDDQLRIFTAQTINALITIESGFDLEENN